MGAIYKREMKAYFTSIITYVLFAAFFMSQSFSFIELYGYGDVSIYYIPIGGLSGLLTVFLIPVLTMRTISEDMRQKVDQVLLTSPVSVTSVILGKFFSCFSIYAIANAPLLIFQLIVSFNATVNWMQFLYSIMGTMLFGAVLISIGIFISSLTESTALSAVLSIVVNLILVYATLIFQILGVEFLIKASAYIALFEKYKAFGESIVKVEDIVYYLSLVVVFVFLTVRSVERRRWA